LASAFACFGTSVICNLSARIKWSGWFAASAARHFCRSHGSNRPRTRASVEQCVAHAPPFRRTVRRQDDGGSRLLMYGGLDVAGELRERLLVEFSPACCAFAAATASEFCFSNAASSAGSPARLPAARCFQLRIKHDRCASDDGVFIAVRFGASIFCTRTFSCRTPPCPPQSGSMNNVFPSGMFAASLEAFDKENVRVQKIDARKPDRL